MKRLSLRAKITLWFSGALLLVVCLTYVTVLSISDQILLKTIRDNLTETVVSNYDEIHFYSSLEDLDPERDTRRFLQFESGYLEINDDFLDEINGVYTALYNSDNTLLYGENPISNATRNLAFSDSKIQNLDVDGVRYYVFDRRLVAKGLDGLWIRGVVSKNQGAVQINTITRVSLILMPILVLLSCAGGYYIVKRMLKPIQKISETALQIGESNDLKKRIELKGGRDELSQLACAFNDTFAKLDAAFEAQRQFISDASHELRTPLAVITAQCEYSLEKPRSTEEYESAFRVVKRQSRRLAKLINDMLDFSRLESGSDRYKKEAVDLTELVSSVCGEMALIRENGITLEWETEPGLVITGNRELLSHLLGNLITNAYRYGRPDGHIRVNLKKEGNNTVLSVEDDGIGIAEEEQEKIFRRFYQVDSSRSGSGAGLGLSMASEIARFHGGTITVRSELGKGSIFSVIF